MFYDKETTDLLMDSMSKIDMKKVEIKNYKAKENIRNYDKTKDIALECELADLEKLKLSYNKQEDEEELVYSEKK